MYVSWIHPFTTQLLKGAKAVISHCILPWNATAGDSEDEDDDESSNESSDQESESSNESSDESSVHDYDDFSAYPVVS